MPAVDDIKISVSLFRNAVIRAAFAQSIVANVLFEPPSDLVRITEDGEVRITEDGEIRLISLG